MKRATNYLAWQKRLISPYTGSRILEIGAGIGNITRMLAASAKVVVALEPNEFCYNQLINMARQEPRIRPIKAFAENIGAHLNSDDTKEKFDCVVSTNVFEHIPDDRAALHAIRPWLRPRARIIIQVPAGMWAFGKIDEALGHYRRYDKKSVKALFKEIPGRFLELRYYNTLGILGWWVNAKLRKSVTQSNSQIWLFDRIILPPQCLVEGIIRPPFGQTIFCVYEYQAP